MKILIILFLFSFNILGQGCADIGVPNSTILMSFLADEKMQEHTGYDLMYVSDLSIDASKATITYQIDKGSKESVTYEICGTQIDFNHL